MANARIGLNGKLYIGAAGVDPATEVKGARNVTLNMQRGDVDVSSRGSAPYKNSGVALLEVSIEFELLDDGDTAVDTLRTNFLAGTVTGVKALDNPTTDTANGSDGFKADCVITEFTREEPMDGAITYKVVVKPTHSASAPSWIHNAPTP